MWVQLHSFGHEICKWRWRTSPTDPQSCNLMPSSGCPPVHQDPYLCSTVRRDVRVSVVFPALFTGMLRDGAHPNGSSGMSAASSQWGRVEATSPRGWQQLLGPSLPIQRSVTALGQAPGGGNTRPDKLQSRQELGFNCLSKRVSPRGEVFIERWSHVSSAFHGCNRHFISGVAPAARVPGI